METRTIYKFVPVWDFDKEEKWLNEMAFKGFKLTKASFGYYKFEKCEPGEYTIRLCFDEIDAADPYVEHIDNFFRWHFYAKKTEYGPFELISDFDGKINHLSRIINMLKTICLANIIIGLVNTFNELNFGWINILAATVLAYGWGRVEGKKEALIKDRDLFE